MPLRLGVAMPLRLPVVPTPLAATAAATSESGSMPEPAGDMEGTEREGSGRMMAK